MTSDVGFETRSFEQLASAGILIVNDGYRTKRAELGDTGFQILRVGQVHDGTLQPPSEPEFVRQEFRSKIGAKLAQSGDIILTTKGTVGRRARVPITADAYVYSPQVCFFRVLDEKAVDPDYLYYWLGGPEFLVQAAGIKAQTDMADYISLRDLRKMRVSFPPIEIQRKVGQALRSFDNRIELNRRMSQTLEGIARAMFKSWFVDFDPVRAKMESRPLSGLGAEFAGLFPDNLTDSELGPIPQGWAISSIGEEYQYVMGQSPPGSSYNETGEGVPLFQGKGEFGFRYPTVRLFCTEPKRMASAGDTLVSVRAPVGAMNLASVECCIGRGLAAVRHKSGSASFTYYSLRELTDAFTAYDSEGTVFGSINKKDFGEIRCLQIPESLGLRVDELLSPIDALIEVKEEEQRTLVELRDSLLPRLVSGEIRVEDAEQLTESAV